MEISQIWVFFVEQQESHKGGYFCVEQQVSRKGGHFCVEQQESVRNCHLRKFTKNGLEVWVIGPTESFL